MKKIKRDTRGLNYALKHNVKCVLVDTVTGEIMQFGGSAGSNLKRYAKKWDGMFPDRTTETMSVEAYISRTEIKY